MKKNILLVNDTSLVCHHGCTLLMQCIYKLFKKNNIVVKDRIFYEENFTNYLSKNMNFDLILINGEGTIHGKKNADIKKVKQIFDFIKSIKKNYKIPIIIFNSTISSLNKKQLKILRMVDKLYVREFYSYNYLKLNKINSTIVPDLLSLLKFKDNKIGSSVIVNDSSIKINNKKLKQFAKFNNYTYEPILYNNYLRYLRYFIYKFKSIYELEFIIKFYLIIKKYYVRIFLNKIDNSKFIVTGRFHSIFIALARMKPFYTFESDTYKVRGLLDMLGLRSRIININSLKNKPIFLKNFTKSEIYKIKKFKKKTNETIKIFIRELKEI
jgi:polysaccharide pyruvyl transferase WcaK-like protein